MKDFAKSWDQKSWEYAVKMHSLCRQRIAALETQDTDRILIKHMISYNKQQLADLETKYPQLKGN